MKLYLISQNVNNDYDAYDSAVVAAESVKDARNTHPRSEFNPTNWPDQDSGTWTVPSKVKVKYLGEAKEGTKAGVICSSFNAG